MQLGRLRFGFSKISLYPPPPPPHSLVLTSDASQSGWDAILPPHRVSGSWSKEESLVHINSLELRAGPEVSRSSCHRSVSSVSFGQHNSRVLYQLPGRNSLPLSLSADYRVLGSTINTYIHLSILCYSLNSSQIELNYFTECLPYTAHPSRVRHVTTRTPSPFPLLASHERVVFQTFSA